MDALTLRDAAADDLVAINDIYNHYVASSTATYQEEPETIESRRAWLARRGPDHPVTVAIQGDRVVGWGSLSPFHPRSAYRRTVENSVYLHPDFHRRGIGRALMIDLIGRARKAGHHTIIAGIDAEQAASVKLHDRLGFERVGHLKRVGFKFGRWLDVIYMQLMV